MARSCEGCVEVRASQIKATSTRGPVPGHPGNRSLWSVKGQLCPCLLLLSDPCADLFVLACPCPGRSLKRASSLSALNLSGKASEDRSQVRSLPGAALGCTAARWRLCPPALPPVQWWSLDIPHHHANVRYGEGPRVALSESAVAPAPRTQ